MNDNKLLYNLVSKTLEPTLKLHQKLINKLTNDIGTLTKEIESITIYINKLKVYIDNVKQNKLHK